MDLVKIGKYIAAKRKSLGLTQVQLAEKLGMSDKSVSKWERGVCLPDVSVYMELCDILGISLNEFLAGEDLAQEDVVKQSEENLIQITADGSSRRKKLQRLVVVLLCVSILGAFMVLYLLFSYGFFRNNYISPVPKDSVEMQTAEVLAGIDGAYLYHYETSDSYQKMTVYLTVYESGEVAKQEELLTASIENADRNEGVVAVIPDFENFKVKVVVADEATKCSAEFPILEGVKDREYYGRSVSEIERNINISKNEKYGLTALIYDDDELCGLPVEDIESEKAGKENDYVYYLSVSFEDDKM